MNRAFVREDAPDGVVFVPPRAPLPPGVVNYVTPRGLRLLKEEMALLEIEKAHLQSQKSGDAERLRLLTIARGRHADLKARIDMAKLVDPASQPPDEVRFGAVVLLRGDTERYLTIVGVDESSAEDGRIAFVTPVARALIGRRQGDSVDLPSPSGPRTFEIADISYETSA